MSRGKYALFAALSISLGLLASLLIFEGVFLVLEKAQASAISQSGPGGKWEAHPRWGWRPSVGHFHQSTHEFSIEGHINSLYMNDPPVDLAHDALRTRVLALGDSHTYAVGVSMTETWPRRLEAKLNATGSGDFRVYNAGVSGYSLHQYLLRLMDQGPVIKPQFVLVGLSFATDLYDLLPPDRGGWVYGGDRARDYFDFDSTGRLTQRHWQPLPGDSVRAARKPALRIREMLDHSATFRYLRRSKLALFIGSKIRVDGQSLWPNMEVIVEKTIGPNHSYQWRLFEALLLEIDAETRRQGAVLIVVGIPYIAQVYDELWDATFGGNPRFARTAGSERVANFCRQNGIPYVDTLPAQQVRSRRLGKWVHHKADAHPTPEGQDTIAEAIVTTRLVTGRQQR